MAIDPDVHCVAWYAGVGVEVALAVWSSDFMIILWIMRQRKL